VIDIGAGPGVFSLLACQFGASNVIAIEPDDSVELLRDLAKDNGYADRITIFQGLSTEFQTRAKADVIVSDIRGCLPLFEGHVSTIADARRRLLAPNGRLIPARDKLQVALVEIPDDYASYETPWHHNRLGLDLTLGRRYLANSWSKVRLGADRMLCQPAELGTLDYYTIEDPDFASKAGLVVDRPGTAHGLLVWFDAELAEGIGFSNAPGAPPQIYGQTFLPFDGGVEVVQGDHITAEFAANLIDGSYVWGWSGEIRRGDAAPLVVFRHSTFMSRVLSPQTLRSRASNFVPSKSTLHEIDVSCLSLIDGERSLGDIANELHAQFPDRFDGSNDALSHVANLTARYR
jgi:protein arginine N-methyltransferase 1